MGTRGTYGFRKDGSDKLTYNHFDSYPDGLGKTMIEFVQESTDEQLGAYAQEMVMVDSNVPATPKQVEACKQYFDGEVGNRMSTDWYGLLREAQGTPSEYAKGLRYMIDNSDFVKDSLFCEYGYIVNMDEGVLEFYKGFNKNPDADGRYAQIDATDEMGYVGIELIKAFTFAEIRERGVNDVIKEMNELVNEEEE
jgi:hypothetical protein